MFSLSLDADVARIRIGRPEARNALTVAGWATLRALADDVATNATAAAILHAAPGEVFSAGADLPELAALADAPERRAPFREAMADALAAVRALPMPTIAAIERGCYGAGVALAMACDVRIAAPDARFAIPPARLGILYPAEDVRRLATLTGEGQAIRLLAGGETIDGAEAARIGLVELLADDPRAAADALAARIAANAGESVRALKRFVRDPAPADAEAAFEAAFGGGEFRRRLAHGR